MASRLIFDDNINVYVQGENALTDGRSADGGELFTNFLIGGCSDLVLIDLRQLGWHNVKEFTVPSYTQVLWDDDTEQMKIILHKQNGKINRKKLLYFGTVNDGDKFPAVVDWEVFKESPLGEKVIPFVALLSYK
jgi:hypothetical protein